MDTVVIFNNELSGLYDTRPPISKAKMASITKTAMKAIKFYKHVVQSVEKFILKCKAEYKVPGLYVIDSIVRQSRHQFGVEKDVFAPRFARNMQSTFSNLFRCAPEDKSKIIRVLNLWQKNNVFAPEVIQPLFDLADPNHPIYQQQQMQAGTSAASCSSNGINLGTGMGQDSPPSNIVDDGHTMSSEMSGPITIPTASQLDSSTIRQLQQLQQFLIRQTESSGSSAGPSTSSAAHLPDSVKFNKKLLDYDYDEDDDDDNKQLSPRGGAGGSNTESNSISKLLNDPTVLRQLQTLQKLKQQEEKQSKLTKMQMQEEAFEKHLATVLKQSSAVNSIVVVDQNEPDVELVSDDGGKVEVINLDGNSRSPSTDRDRYKRRRSRSRSRPGDRGRRGGARGRSSRSRSRSPRSRRRGGGSRDRNKDKDKDREREKKSEYERERRRRGVPEIKKDHLSVCSTTLWVGHLSKLVQQEELSDTFGKYGDIVTIDMIHPRGCAFIVMNRRQDAYKAMGGLKSHKLQGRAITISWAAGKGVKSKEWKDYWDIELGVSYIPWNKLEQTTDFESMEEGGMIDEDSMPAWLKEKTKLSNQKKELGVAGPIGALGGGVPGAGVMYGVMSDMGHGVDTTQPPPTGPPPQLMAGMQFGMAGRMMPPMGMHMPSQMSGMPLGVPPPPIMGMVPTMPPLDKSIPPPHGPPPPPGGAAFMGHYPPPMPGMVGHLPPPAPSISTTAAAATALGDDHMDIDMDDEPASVSMGGMFNRPPPQLFAGGQSMPGMPPVPPNMPPIMRDDRDRRRGRSGSRERRDDSRERDFDRGRDRDRDGRKRDRDNRSGGGRSDFGRGDRDRNSSSRWGGSDRGGGHLRDDDVPLPPLPPSMGHRGEQRHNSRDRMTSRDRNDRGGGEMALSDRLREIAGGGDPNHPEFGRRGEGGELSQWRDVPMHGPGGGGGSGGGPFNPMNFIDQGPRGVGIRPMNMLQMGGGGGPNFRGGNDYDYNNRGGGSDFDRRGMSRGGMFDGGPPSNRFGPPGPGGNRGGGGGGPPMGMNRGGGGGGNGGPPQFGPRMGPTSPMFMRGQRPGPPGTMLPGPPGAAGFNDRPPFDGYVDREDRSRGGRNGGMGAEQRGSRGGRSDRPGWSDRAADDDEQLHLDTVKDDVVGGGGGGGTSSNGNSAKRATSRWTNSSPKSVVSDEENWDDLEEGGNKTADDNKKTSNSEKSSNDSKTKTTLTSVSSTATTTEVQNNNNNKINEQLLQVPPLPQTEPIDDDSQEDDFNDFDDDGSTTVAQQQEKTESSPIPPADNVCNAEDVNRSTNAIAHSPTTTAHSPTATEERNNSIEENGNTNIDDNGSECSGGRGANTTPLYDEPEAAKTTTNIEDDNDDERRTRDNYDGESSHCEEENYEQQPELNAIAQNKDKISDDDDFEDARSETNTNNGQQQEMHREMNQNSNDDNDDVIQNQRNSSPYLSPIASENSPLESVAPASETAANQSPNLSEATADDNGDNQEQAAHNDESLQSE